MGRIKIINPIATTIKKDVIFIHPFSPHESSHICSKGKEPTILNVIEQL